ncbi:MAG: helix-turn-helix transcriptional regulator [Clostridia bacterium]|nr:helix-turn-helix transcriptional regulator [Clostridia bacterium]
MREWLGPARMAKGLSQAEMAEKLGISESYYSCIEAGKRQKKMDITLVTKLAVVLELPLGRVIDLEMRKGGD